jgi:hypothetical protein
MLIKLIVAMTKAVSKASVVSGLTWTPILDLGSSTVSVTTRK